MKEKMSIRPPDVIAERLPPKLKTNSAGLRKLPQVEQNVNYINYGQETVIYPDRQAKSIRNHPFVTQLDFFDTQEEAELRLQRSGYQVVLEDDDGANYLDSLGASAYLQKVLAGCRCSIGWNLPGGPR